MQTTDQKIEFNVWAKDWLVKNKYLSEDSEDVLIRENNMIGNLWNGIYKRLNLLLDDAFQSKRTCPKVTPPESIADENVEQFFRNIALKKADSECRKRFEYLNPTEIKLFEKVLDVITKGGPKKGMKNSNIFHALQKDKWEVLSFEDRAELWQLISDLVSADEPNDIQEWLAPPLGDWRFPNEITHLKSVELRLLDPPEYRVIKAFQTIRYNLELISQLNPPEDSDKAKDFVSDKFNELLKNLDEKFQISKNNTANNFEIDEYLESLISDESV